MESIIDIKPAGSLLQGRLSSYKYFSFLFLVNSAALKKKISDTLENQQIQQDYIHLVLDQETIAELEPETVYFLDLRKLNPTMEIRYFINLASDILLKCCGQCGKFFLLDEYEF